MSLVSLVSFASLMNPIPPSVKKCSNLELYNTKPILLFSIECLPQKSSDIVVISYKVSWQHESESENVKPKPRKGKGTIQKGPFLTQMTHRTRPETREAKCCYNEHFPVVSRIDSDANAKML